jgi:hypothetical protein
MNAWRKEMMACQDSMEACRDAMEACLEKAKANPEKMKASLEEMQATVDVFKERLDKMDTKDLETNQEKLDAITEHQDVPEEEATVETTGTLEDQYGGWHLAVGSCQHPKKWTQGNGGSRKKLATAHQWMARCAIPAPRKGYGH